MPTTVFAVDKTDPYFPKAGFFNELHLGANIGTTGLGLEVATPCGDFLRLRAGVDYLPKFDYTMSFGIRLGNEPASKFDANGELTKFGRLANMLHDLTGYEPSERVSITGHPTFLNFHFLVDIHPFINKKWRFTTGFYAGGSRVAKGENTVAEAPTLFAVNMYNKIYEKVLDEEPIFMGAEAPPEIAERILRNGTLGMVLGEYSHDITDAEGNVVHKAGEPYKMLPDENCMVHTRINTNCIRPYLGFGYGGKLPKAERLDCSFDCGVMYVGDIHIHTHDGTCLSHDVQNYGQSIKGAMNFFNAVKVYPVLNFRIAYRLF